MRKAFKTLTLCTVLSAQLAYAEDRFVLESADFAEGQPLALKHHLNGFGCEGDNISPALSWSGAPSETKSFAVTLYDPDASSGSGWWHWSVYNIPADVTSLDTNAGSGAGLPASSSQGMTDFGTFGFAGACPPPGEMHRYQFHVHAISVEKIDIPENATPAMVEIGRAHV